MQMSRYQRRSVDLHWAVVGGGQAAGRLSAAPGFHARAVTGRAASIAGARDV